MVVLALSPLLQDPEVLLRGSAPSAAADPGCMPATPSSRHHLVAPQGPDLPRQQTQTTGAPPKAASGGRVSL